MSSEELTLKADTVQRIAPFMAILLLCACILPWISGLAYVAGCFGQIGFLLPMLIFVIGTARSFSIDHPKLTLCLIISFGLICLSASLWNLNAMVPLTLFAYAFSCVIWSWRVSAIARSGTLLLTLVLLIFAGLYSHSLTMRSTTAERLNAYGAKSEIPDNGGSKPDGEDVQTGRKF